jgi:hypothetical protein
MPSTTRLHADVANTVLQEAYRVLPHPVALDPTHRVFDTDAAGRDRPIGGLFRWDEFTAPRLFLGLDDRHPLERTTLEPPLLRETTPIGQGIAGQIRQVFIMGFALTGVAPEVHVTGCVDDQQVVDRVALLLTTVLVVLCLWIFGAVERPLRTSMPTRGDMRTTVVRSAARQAANSSAVRAGSSSWCAQA